MRLGGRGSGRHRKPLSRVIEEVQDELLEVDVLMDIDKDEARVRIGRLIARLGHHRVKLKRIEELREKVRRLRK